MIRTILVYLDIFVLLIPTLPFLLVVKIYDMQGKIEKREKLIHAVASAWAKSIVLSSGTKVKISGEENIPKDSAVLFISNHQGNFDIPILISYINKPMGFISKIEIKKMPIINSWMKYMKCVFMDRKSMRQSAESIIVGAGYLKEGYSLIIFPEGTRSNGTNMGEFKPGSFKLATKAGVPIIPVTINGSYKIMNKGKLTIRPANVEIIISPPIETKDIPRGEFQNLVDNVKSIISHNLDILK